MEKKIHIKVYESNQKIIAREKVTTKEKNTYLMI